jgi:hypothetical protein
MAVTALLLVTVAAIEPSRPAAAAAVPRDGTASGRASASCWSIKQNFPASTDGVYWLVNPQLVAPQQFWCDMTTDGGGWVLVARGREGWTFRQPGQGAASAVRTAPTGPAAFAPAALADTTIDALLGGGRVSDLPDGVRLRRAADAAGSTWQEVRWKLLDLGAWSWAINQGLRLSSFTVGGTTYTNGNTRDNGRTFCTCEAAVTPGVANGVPRIFTSAYSAHGGKAGFSYGAAVTTGTNSATSYLWELADENNAIPFTQVYLRPKLVDAAPIAIPDAGLPASTITPFVSDVNTPLAAGVVGVLKVGDSQPQVDSMVLAITQWNDRIFVGGKFASVQRGPGAALGSQPYLAAFDRATGAWIDTFRPALDGTVWDLAVTPSGKLVVAGQFTNVGGAANTSSLVELDPTTGAVISGWTASLGLAGVSTRPLGRSVDVDGNWLYVGGNFNRVTGAAGTAVTGRLVRVALADGTLDPTFAPQPNGEVYDLDATPTRVHVAGQFDQLGGAARRKFGSVDTTTGAIVPGLEAFQSSTENWDDPLKDFYGYQQAVLETTTGQVWTAGSEHDIDVFRRSDLHKVRGFIENWNHGDGQAIAQVGGVVFVGSHAVDSGLMSDSYHSPVVTEFSRIDPINRIGAWNAATTDFIDDWEPNISTNSTGEGAWALFGDSAGCLWFGGDFNRGAFIDGAASYLQGFGKFCPRDTVAPTKPSGVAVAARLAGGNNVTWTGSTDDRAGAVKYEVLRNDRVIAGGLTSTGYTDPDGTGTDRYFVRAIDVAGNRSATTSVTLMIDTVAPVAPTGLTAAVQPDDSVVVQWSPTNDNVGVTGYALFVDTVERPAVTTTSITVTGLAPGNHSFQVLAFDAAGNRSAKSTSVSVTIVGPDVTKPTVPTGLTATVQPDGSVLVQWTASTDNIGVTGYAVSDAGVELRTVATTSTTLTGLPAGKHYLQVLAFDAAGNRSAKTSSAVVTTAAGDVTAPSVPTALAGTQNASGVVLTWNASTDNVAVTGYAVFVDGTEVQQPTATTATVAGLTAGAHTFQVLARDAAGNRSARTASLSLVVTGPDTVKPSVPTGFTVALQPDGSVVLAWTASSDNVGVTGYAVFDTGTEIRQVAGTGVTLAPVATGDHWYQVLAFDAAGNRSAKTASVKITR